MAEGAGPPAAGENRGHRGWVSRPAEERTHDARESGPLETCPYPSPNEEILPMPPANQVQRDWEQRNRIVPPDVGKMSGLWGGRKPSASFRRRQGYFKTWVWTWRFVPVPGSLKGSTSPSIFRAHWASLSWLPFRIRAPSGPERVSLSHLHRYQHSSATKMWLNLASLLCAHPLNHIAHISVHRGRGVRAERWLAQLVPSLNHKL